MVVVTIRMKNKHTILNIDVIDFVSHFVTYSKSPITESLKDVLVLDTSTKVIFDKNLYEYSDIDRSKSYPGKEVQELLSNYSENCDKKPISEQKKATRILNGGPTIRISRNDSKNIAYLNDKLVAVVDFKCS